MHYIYTRYIAAVVHFAQTHPKSFAEPFKLTTAQALQPEAPYRLSVLMHEALYTPTRWEGARLLYYVL